MAVHQPLKFNVKNSPLIVHQPTPNSFDDVINERPLTPHYRSYASLIVDKKSENRNRIHRLLADLKREKLHSFDQIAIVVRVVRNVVDQSRNQPPSVADLITHSEKGDVKNIENCQPQDNFWQSLQEHASEDRRFDVDKRNGNNLSNHADKVEKQKCS